jgi:hypothetical protein
MSYTTNKEPYVRQVPPGDPDALVFYIDEELKKIELSLSRINEIVDEIDARLTAGGL